MLNFSELLLTRRKQLKLSLNDLSKKVGISVNSLFKYEKGIRLPSVVNLKKLATALDLDYDELYQLLLAEKK